MTDIKRASAIVEAPQSSFFRQSLTAFFILISAAFLLLPSLAAAQSYRFNTVTVEGNQRIESSAIVTYAGIARGKTVTGGELNAAYQRVLASGLFESAEVIPQGGRLVIKVVEFPTINKISFEGNDRIKDDDLSVLITSESRRVLNPTVAEKDAAIITQAYSQTGRLAARVTPKIIRRSDNRVDLIFEIFEGGLVEIESITFVGNQQYSERRLRRVLNTKQAGLLRALVKRDTFVEDRIEFDKQLLRDFYLARGYVDFRTTSVNSELAQERDGYFVTFNVQEGQQFTLGEITVLSELPDVDSADFMDALKLRSGATYSPLLIEKSIARLERLALRKGLDFVRIDPRVTRNDRDLSLDVEFVLVKGPRIFVERIDIEGNTTTLDRVLRQQFRIVEGDPFNPREIRESADRIRALEFFETSEVNAREGSTPDQVIIDVDVEEKNTGSLTFGGSFSSDLGLGLVIRFEEKNFLGRGQSLGLGLSTASEVADYYLTFNEPGFLGRDLSFGFALRYQESDRTETRFSLTNGEFTPTMSFPVSEHGRMSLNYSLRNVDMVENTVIVGSLIGTEAARGDIWKSSVGYTYTYDTRRTGLDPNRGFLFQIGQDFGGVSGDYTFVKTQIKASAETKVLQEEVTLRATLEGGMLYSPNSDSRVGDRFNMTSAQFRGFAPFGLGPREIGVTAGQDDALGGKYYAVARFEAEFPLGLPEEYGIAGGLFYDVGTIWGVDQSSANVVQAGSSLRHVVGVSLFWDTPVGPLRFNFSKALSKQPFDNDQPFDFTIRSSF